MADKTDEFPGSGWFEQSGEVILISQSRTQMERIGMSFGLVGAFPQASVDGGAFMAITTGFLTDPRDAPLASGNPTTPAQAWCGHPQSHLRAVLKLAPHPGHKVRFRVTRDASLSRAEVWNNDVASIRRCN